MPMPDRNELTRALVKEIIAELESCLNQTPPDSPEHAIAQKLLQSFTTDNVTLAELGKHLREEASPGGTEPDFKEMLLKFLAQCSELGRKTWTTIPPDSDEASYIGQPPKRPKLKQ